MYKLSLIFFCIIGISGCATAPQALDRQSQLEKLEANANDRLDKWNVSQMAFNQDTKELEDLISSGKVDLKRDRAFFQNTITHIMSKCNVKSLKLVLDKGAPLDEINTFEETPLSMAVANKNLDCAQLLLERGAKTTGKFSFDNPLMSIAANTNYIPMIRLLIKHNVCPLNNGFINTPVLEVAGLDRQAKALLSSYIDSYIKKNGPKCPEEKSLPK